MLSIPFKKTTTLIISGREGTQTYITSVFFLQRFVAGVWTHFMCTHHVTGELSAKVVRASAPLPADDLQDHLLELIRSGPQVIQGSPAGRLHLCVCVGVRAACSQVLHSLNSCSGVKRTIQLHKK